MRDVHWHDKPFLPAGELITNNADGDVGKGLYSVERAARFSRGEFGERRMTVFVVAEDDFDTVLKPRLVAAEANLNYVRCLSWRRKGTEDALRIPDDVGGARAGPGGDGGRPGRDRPAALAPVGEDEHAHRPRGQAGASAADAAGAQPRLRRARQRPLRQGEDRRRAQGDDGLDRVHEHAAGRLGDGLRRRGAGRPRRRGDQVEHRPQGRRPQLPARRPSTSRASPSRYRCSSPRARRPRASTS